MKLQLTNRLRELRELQGLTQQQLADKIGVTRQTVNAMEGNKYTPTLETAFKTALALDQPLHQCFSYELLGD